MCFRGQTTTSRASGNFCWFMAQHASERTPGFLPALLRRIHCGGIQSSRHVNKCYGRNLSGCDVFLWGLFVRTGPDYSFTTPSTILLGSWKSTLFLFFLLLNSTTRWTRAPLTNLSFRMLRHWLLQRNEQNATDKTDLHTYKEVFYYFVYFYFYFYFHYNSRKCALNTNRSEPERRKRLQ